MRLAFWRAGKGRAVEQTPTAERGIAMSAPGAYALAGYSQGAMTVLFAGLRRAVSPRGIVAIAGSLIAPDRLAAEITNRAPVLLMHGEEDQLVPAQLSRSAARTLSEAGVAVETLYQPGLAHDLDEVEIKQGALFLKRIFSNHNG